MTRSVDFNRRSVLAAAAGIGVSVTFLGRQAFAATDGHLAKRKLVVIVCRGAMDGLSVSPPVGDANYRSLRGEIAIAEVKSGLDDYRTDRKWGEYAPFCDAFYFAVDANFPRHMLADGPGLMVADAFGGAVLVEAPVIPLAPARRKALTVAFARLAAARALGLE